MATDLEKEKDGDTEIKDDEEIEGEEISDDDKSKDEEEEWMKEGDDSDQTDDSVPLHAHIRAKRKLKGRISDRDEEIDRLKAENAELKSKQSKPLELLKRPRRADFADESGEVDEEKYEKALDDYEESKEDVRFQQLQHTQAIRTSQEATAKKVETAVDAHYGRAEKLLENGISAEAFKASDLTVREAVESIRPKQGDMVVDQLISRLGEGSEKVFFRLGRSKALLGEFVGLLAGDPSGLDAATFLGQQKAILTNTKRRSSNAPSPDTELKGDETAGQKGKILKRRYDEAHKKGEAQKAWNAKKEAKKLGINTSKW